MQILNTNIDVTNKKKVYRLCKSASVRVQDVEQGKSFPVLEWMLYTEEKVDKTGEVKEQRVLSIVTPDGKMSTISDTFISSFLDIVDVMGADPFSIIVIGGQSKSGRQYVDCEMDCSEE